MRFDLAGVDPRYYARVRVGRLVALSGVAIGVVGAAALSVEFAISGRLTQVGASELAGAIVLAALFGLVLSAAKPAPRFFEVDSSGIRAIYANGRVEGVTWNSPGLRVVLGIGSRERDLSPSGTPAYAVWFRSTNYRVTREAYDAIVEEADRQHLSVTPDPRSVAGWSGTNITGPR
jgi:hypothetical protein